MARPTVGVIGAGAWGFSLAAAAARTSGETLLFSRRARDGALPVGVAQVDSLKELAARTRLIVLAVPSSVVRKVARELGDFVDGRHLVIHGIRGLVAHGEAQAAGGASLETVSDVLRHETPSRRVGALGGPALAADLSANRPSVIVGASCFPEVLTAAREVFGTDTLRVYTTPDLRGLEWASALVGCLAIGMGYAQELGIGPGLVAAIITRGSAEAARIVEAAGGEQRTMLGLSGYGDLLACIAQKERPEVVLGAALARRKTLEESMHEAKLRVEAVELVPRVLAWAEHHKVRTPILGALARSLFAQAPPDQVIRELMTAPLEGSA
jgi:glycerol-3-phosphate dehydrogenase (NAD(P)+)